MPLSRLVYVIALFFLLPRIRTLLFMVTVGVWDSLRARRLIPWTLKITTRKRFSVLEGTRTGDLVCWPYQNIIALIFLAEIDKKANYSVETDVYFWF